MSPAPLIPLHQNVKINQPGEDCIFIQISLREVGADSLRAPRRAGGGVCWAAGRGSEAAVVRRTAGWAQFREIAWCSRVQVEGPRALLCVGQTPW